MCDPHRAFGEGVVDVGIPSKFLVDNVSEKFVFFDNQNDCLLYMDGLSSYWAGSWAACWVFLSLSGQAQDAEFFDGKVVLVSFGPGEHASNSLHHIFDFVISDPQVLTSSSSVSSSTNATASLLFFLSQMLIRSAL